MPSFRYHAVDATGRRIRGTAEAVAPAVLADALATDGLTLLIAREVAPATANARGSAQRAPVLDATRALAALLQAGMPLARALAAAGGATTPAVAVTLDTVRHSVERGTPLATALGEHPVLFGALYVGTVRAGERSGDLAGAFDRLAAQLEREAELRARLLTAAIYPSLLAVAGGAAVVVLLVFVLPRFAELLTGAGAELPRSTRLVLRASELVRAHALLLLAILVAVAGIAAWMRTSASGRRTWAGILLALPVVGGFRRQALGARFARLTAVLLGGGAPLLAALDGVELSIGDTVAAEDVARVRASVREGGRLHQALAASTVFPPVLAQLTSVGEDSGKLRDFLGRAGDILDRRAERALQRLVALVEPVTIIVFGGIVGFVALSLLQAIYGVNASAFR